MPADHCRNRISGQPNHDGIAHLACHQGFPGAHFHLVEALVQTHLLRYGPDQIVIPDRGTADGDDQIRTLGQRQRRFDRGRGVLGDRQDTGMSAHAVKQGFQTEGVRHDDLIPTGGIAGHDQFIPCGNQGDIGLACYRDRRDIHRRKQRNVIRAQYARGLQNEAFRKIIPCRTDIAIPTGITVDCDRVYEPVHVFLQNHEIHAFGDGGASENPHGLSGADRAIKPMTRSGFTDDFELCTDGNLIGTNPVPVHRRGSKGRLRPRCRHVCGHNPPRRLGQRNLFGSKRGNQRKQML